MKFSVIPNLLRQMKQSDIVVDAKHDSIWIKKNRSDSSRRQNLWRCSVEKQSSAKIKGESKGEGNLFKNVVRRMGEDKYNRMLQTIKMYSYVFEQR